MAISQTEVKKIVSNHFNKKISLDDTAMFLVQAGIKFSDIQNTINTVGIKNDWVLTGEKLEEKVKQHLAGKTVSHFLDVVALAKSLDISQLSDSEKQKAIIDFSDTSKAKLVPSKKFKQFNNSGHMGKIASWIKSNPNFSHSELLDSGLIADAPNRVEYFEEFLSYRAFFESLQA